MRTEKQQDEWFQQVVVKPAFDAWGPAGWDRLSDDVRLDAVYAQVGRLLLNIARLEDGDNTAQNGAYVRYAQQINDCVRRWRDSVDL